MNYKLKIKKIKKQDQYDNCDYCDKPASLMVYYNEEIDWSQSCKKHKKDAIESLGNGV